MSIPPSIKCHLPPSLFLPTTACSIPTLLLLLFILFLQRYDPFLPLHFVQIRGELAHHRPAAQPGLHSLDSDLAPMVCDPVLGEVVRSYPLAPVPPAHQRAPHPAPVPQRLILPKLVHPRGDQLQGLGLVLVLRPFILYASDNSGGNVGHAHRALGGVNMLSPGPASSHYVDSYLRRRQCRRDVGIGDGGENGNGDGGGLHFGILCKRETKDE